MYIVHVHLPSALSSNMVDSNCCCGRISYGRTCYNVLLHKNFIHVDMYMYMYVNMYTYLSTWCSVTGFSEEDFFNSD